MEKLSKLSCRGLRFEVCGSDDGTRCMSHRDELVIGVCGRTDNFDGARCCWEKYTSASAIAVGCGGRGGFQSLEEADVGGGSVPDFGKD